MATISVTFNYQGQQVIVPLEERCETRAELIRRSRDIINLTNHIIDNTSPRTILPLDLEVEQILDTIQKKIPEAKSSEEGRIFEAYIVTALLVSICVVTAIFVGGFVSYSIEVKALVLFAAVMIHWISYDWYNDDFTLPKRLYGKEYPEPWYHPELNRFQVCLVGLTIVGPLIMGLVSPLLEAYTRVERWEEVLQKQKEKLVHNVAILVEFYKQQGQTTLNQLQEAALDPIKAEDYQRMIQCFQEVAAFLKKFDAHVPDFTSSNVG